MKKKLKNKLAKILKPRPDLSVSEFCEANVDFSRAPNYDSECKTKYRADYMPFWIEPMNLGTDLTVREVYILKAARAGCSENVLLNNLRYSVAINPRQTMWVTASQLSAERYVKGRIVPALQMTSGADEVTKNAKITEHDIDFGTMSMTLAWSGNKTAFKQSGYSLILADEISTYKDVSLNMLRKRGDNYTFSTIFAISSPDPAQKRPVDEDPIFQAFEEGDKRYFFMKDKSGEEFRFEMGGPGTSYGLKWDHSAKLENGEWDLNKVFQTAYYVTPSGERIDEKDRWNYVKKGYWRPTKEALAGIRSYHINAFYLPFKSGTFGSIATEFLKAKNAGPEQLKQFFFEVLAEKFYASYIQPNISTLDNLAAPFKKGELPSKVLPDLKDKKGFTRFTTADVQKNSLWVLNSEFCQETGDIYIVDWKQLYNWSEFATNRKEFNPHIQVVDASYKTSEVREMGIVHKFFPLFNRAKANKATYMSKENPFEGTAKQYLGFEQDVLHINGDLFKDIAVDLLNQRTKKPRIFIPENADATLRMHLTSEKKADGKWVKVRNDNHLWDTLIYLLSFLAYSRHLRVEGLEEEVTEEGTDSSQ